MLDDMRGSQRSGSTVSRERRRRAAWILILVADAGLLAWGAMAAALPDHLLGPGGQPILSAGYEGFTHSSWSELVRATPAAAGYIEILFRMYGVYIVGFGLLAIGITLTAFRRAEPWAWWLLLVGNTIAYVSAMAYDRIVNAIGPFELSEYLGLALIYGALAITRPVLSTRLDASTPQPRPT